MNDAARAQSCGHVPDVQVCLGCYEEEIARRVAEQTAALQEELESYKDPQVVTIPAQDLDALREENARLRGLAGKFRKHIGVHSSGGFGSCRGCNEVLAAADALLADPEGQAHEDSIMRLSREIEEGKADNMVLLQEKEQADRLAASQTARLSLEISNKRALAQAVRDYIVIPSDLPQEEQLNRLKALSKCADDALQAEGQAGEEWR